MSDDTPDLKIAELEARLVEMEARATQRLVQSELRSLALRAGLIDVDALKLIDPASLKLDDEGNLENASKLMSEFKRNKPYLFGGSNSSTTAVLPPTTPPAAKRATQMTHDEWQAARAELIRRR